jgi:hypothetical protein
LEKYHEFIKQLIEDDKFDLEVETMDLKARTLDKSIIQVGAGLKSPFSDNTFIERCEVNILRKPYSTAELEKEIRNSLEGKTPDQLNNEILEKLKVLSIMKSEKNVKVSVIALSFARIELQLKSLQ